MKSANNSNVYHVKLGDVCEFVYGKGLIKSKRNGTGKYPVYGSNGVIGCHNEYLVEGPCLIIGRKGAAGEVHLSNKNCWPIDTTYFIKQNEKYSVDYLYFILKNLRLNSLDKSTAIPGLNRNDAYKLTIPLPPLPEQKEIVAKIEELFSELENGIEQLKKIKEQLKSYKQAFLNYAFRGRLVKRTHSPRSSAGKEAYQDGVQVVSKAAEPKVEYGNNELPEGWKWVKLGEIANIISGFAFKSTSFLKEGKFQVIKIGNVRPERLRLSEKPAYLNYVDQIVLNKYLLQKNDLIISLTGTRKKRDYGFVAKVNKENNLLLNQRLAAIRLTDENNSVFFMYILKMNVFLDQFFENETGNVGQGNVGINALKNARIPIPPIEEQHQIVEEIESHFSVAEKLEQVIDENLKKAETLRQAILKHAFEGKLIKN